MSNLTEQQLAVIAKMPDVIRISVPEELYDSEDPWGEDENLVIDIEDAALPVAKITGYAHLYYTKAPAQPEESQ
jgi:hypothetical protein